MFRCWRNEASRLIAPRRQREHCVWNFTVRPGLTTSVARADALDSCSASAICSRIFSANKERSSIRSPFVPSEPPITGLLQTSILIRLHARPASSLTSSEATHFADCQCGRRSSRKKVSSPHLTDRCQTPRKLEPAEPSRKHAITVLPSIALPETADELRTIAKILGAKPEDIKLGEAASVTTVKNQPLANYRVVYFATHALVAGEVEKFAKVKAEPALVLSIPDKPSEQDDGLLKASEVAMLKMNADFRLARARDGRHEGNRRSRGGAIAGGRRKSARVSAGTARYACAGRLVCCR
jgi:hypothetical protein